MAINLASATVKATNHPNKRTIAAHFGDVYNVKGFLAVGDNVADDTTKIQAAVDAAIAAGGGTVYFPIGNYKVTAPITFNNDSEVGIRFLGETDGTLVLGTFNNYILSRSLATPNNTRAIRIIERLQILNDGATGGCIRIGSSIGAVIRNCTIKGHIGINTEDSVGVSSENTQIIDCRLGARSGVNYTGANGIIIGGGGSIISTDIRSQNVGIRAYGSGLAIISGRIERCSQAHVYGLDSAGNDVGLSGLAVSAHTFEGNWTAIDFEGTASGFSLGGLYILGHDGSNSGPTGSGMVGLPASKGTEYGIRVRANKATNGAIRSVTIGSWHDVACFLMADSTNRANILVSSVSATQTGGAGVGWSLPTKAHTATFRNVNTAVVYTFANLSSVPIEGEEFTITDSNTATWGATAAGGGANRVLVRYNGTNWTVVGA